MTIRKEVWPPIYSSERAIVFMHSGAGMAAFSSVLTAAINITAICLKRPVLGMDGWGLIEAALFAVIAWRVYRLSTAWAVFGLALFTLEKLIGIIINPRLGATSVAGIIFLFFYVHAVRGGLYLRKLKKAHSVPPLPAADSDAA